MNNAIFKRCLANKSCPIWLHFCRENNIDNHTAEEVSGLKVAKLDQVPGMEVFKETNDTVKATALDKKQIILSHIMRYFVMQVYPVALFPDQSIVQASKNLVRQHQEKYSQTSRILQQVLYISFQSDILVGNDFHSLTNFSLCSAPNHRAASH